MSPVVAYLLFVGIYLLDLMCAFAGICKRTVQLPKKTYSGLSFRWTVPLPGMAEKLQLSTDF